jgi:hypothetical protein
VAFELRVSDGTSTSIDTMTVTINADDDAPTADAGVDQVVSENDVVTLGGSGSDVEGQDLSYQWVQTSGPSVTLDDPTSASPSFTAPEGVTNSAVAFELRVSDGTSTSIDTMTVTINAEDDAPTPTASEPAVVAPEPVGKAPAPSVTPQPVVEQSTPLSEPEPTESFPPSAPVTHATPVEPVDAREPLPSSVVAEPSDPESGGVGDTANADTNGEPDSLWDGGEDMQVLDPAAGIEGVESVNPFPGGLDPSEMADPAFGLRAVDDATAFGGRGEELVLDEDEPDRAQIDLPAQGRGIAFDQFFSEMQTPGAPLATGVPEFGASTDIEPSVRQPTLEQGDAAEQVGDRAGAQREPLAPIGGESRGDEQRADLRPTEEEEPAMQRDRATGFFPMLWGLLRGRAGSSGHGEDETRKNRKGG